MLHKRLASIGLLLAILLSTAGPAPAKPKLSSLRKLRDQQKHAASQIRQHRAQLRGLKQREKTARNNWAAAAHREAINRANRNEVRRQLRQTRHRLTAAQNNIARITQRLNRQNDFLAHRLIDNYKHGGISYMNVLLGSNSFSDMLERGAIIGKVIRSDMDLIGSIRQDRAGLQQQEEMLRNQEAERTRLERRHSTLLRESYEVQEECAELLQKAKTDRITYEQMVAAEEARARQIASMIRRMQRTPAGRQRMQTAWHGTLMRPVGGRLSCGFGPRIHPIWKTRSNHTGVDLACSSGTPIAAAGDGYVMTASWDSIYGNMIIIDHGGGLTTLYGHCSRLAVHSGQTVKKGRTIGYVGSTGWSTGPHLHFEVRKNGTPVNPM